MVLSSLKLLNSVSRYKASTRSMYESDCKAFHGISKNPLHIKKKGAAFAVPFWVGECQRLVPTMVATTHSLTSGWLALHVYMVILLVPSCCSPEVSVVDTVVMLETT